MQIGCKCGGGARETLTRTYIQSITSKEEHIRLTEAFEMLRDNELSMNESLDIESQCGTNAGNVLSVEFLENGGLPCVI